MEIRTLKEWRELRGVTIRGLAEQTGMSTRTIMLAENGQREPTLRTWRRICDVLGIKPEQVAEFRQSARMNP